MPEGEHVAAEVLSASLGGIVSASALYPLEVLKTKMQAGAAVENSRKNDTETKEDNKNDADDEGDSEKESPPTTTIALAKQMYKEDGISAFYNGVGTSTFQSATEKALYFFAYSSFKNMYTSLTSSKELGTVANLALGCAAEWAHLPITLPIDCLSTKIQTSKSDAGAFTLMSAMLSEKGFSGMYKGIQAYTVLCLKPSIQYTVYEQVKKIILAGRSTNKNRGVSKKKQELSAVEAFLLGIVARTIATVAVFPYLRAKVMLQSQKGGGKNTDNSIPLMLLKMYQAGGMKSLFQGLGPELTRGIFSAAFMLMVKEKITGIVSLALRGQIQ